MLNAPHYLLYIYSNSTQVVIGVLLEYVDAAAVAANGLILYSLGQSSGSRLP
jgi:hypothetical protein